jgi:putative transposase
MPRKIITDQLRSYPAAKAEIPELASIKHVFVKASARLNNWLKTEPPADTRTRAVLARISRPQAHPGVSPELRTDPATLRAQATFAARVSLSHTALQRFDAWHRFIEITQGRSAF